MYAWEKYVITRNKTIEDLGHAILKAKNEAFLDVLLEFLDASRGL